RRRKAGHHHPGAQGMKRAALLIAFSALVLGAGCNSDLAGDRERTPSATGTGAGGASTGSTSTSSTTTGSGGSGMGGMMPPTANDLKARCGMSNVAPPMLRRLTRTELENSILDIFPQIAPMYTGVKLGPDALSSLKFTNDASVLLVGSDTAKDVLKTAK